MIFKKVRGVAIKAEFKESKKKTEEIERRKNSDMRPFAPWETVYLYADRKDGNWGRSGLGHLKLFVGWVLITK
jgi:hypothetical protein